MVTKLSSLSFFPRVKGTCTQHFNVVAVDSADILNYRLQPKFKSSSTGVRPNFSTSGVDHHHTNPRPKLPTNNKIVARIPASSSGGKREEDEDHNNRTFVDQAIGDNSNLEHHAKIPKNRPNYQISSTPKVRMLKEPQAQEKRHAIQNAKVKIDCTGQADARSNMNELLLDEAQNKRRTPANRRRWTKVLGDSIVDGVIRSTRKMVGYLATCCNVDVVNSTVI